MAILRRKPDGSVEWCPSDQTPKQVICTTAIGTVYVLAVPPGLAGQ
jgi:hypothetical protein